MLAAHDRVNVYDARCRAGKNLATAYTYVSSWIRAFEKKPSRKLAE
jgi:hypothetical protein